MMCVSFSVNMVKKGQGNDDDYYTYSATKYGDDDDLYGDCQYIPELDSSYDYEVGMFVCATRDNWKKNMLHSIHRLIINLDGAKQSVGLICEKFNVH